MGFIKALFASLIVKSKVERLCEQSDTLFAQTVEGYIKIITIITGNATNLLKCFTSVIKNHSSEVSQAIVLLTPALKELKDALVEASKNIKNMDDELVPNGEQIKGTIKEFKIILDIPEAPSTPKDSSTPGYYGLRKGSTKAEVFEVMKKPERETSSIDDHVWCHLYYKDGSRFHLKNDEVFEINLPTIENKEE